MLAITEKQTKTFILNNLVALTSDFRLLKDQSNYSKLDSLAVQLVGNEKQSLLLGRMFATQHPALEFTRFNEVEFLSILKEWGITPVNAESFTVEELSIYGATVINTLSSMITAHNALKHTKATIKTKINNTKTNINQFFSFIGVVIAGFLIIGFTAGIINAVYQFSKLIF